MRDFIQESEVNEVLNKRHADFTPKLGSFYGVEVGNGGEIKYAKLASIDYTNDFPYLCSVIVRNAISIDGRAASPAKFEERRFDYSGTSEGGKSALCNLSAEDKARIGVVSDIASFNKRSWTNLLEQQECSFILVVLICAIVIVILLLNRSASLLAIISGKIDLNGTLLSSVFLTICLILALLFCTEIYGLRIVRNKIFTTSSFNKFVTEDGKSVVITNKFGDDNDFPMEGYIIVSPEIRNGDTVVREGVVVTHKWSYSGLPYGHKRGGAGFKDFKLFNTPEDRGVVLALFDKKYG